MFMKRIITLCLAMMVFVSSVSAGNPPEFTPRKTFSNLGIGVTASTSGFGVSLATPLSKHLALRGGYMFSPLSFSYTYDEFEPIDVKGVTTVDIPPLDLTANLQSGNANVMIDWIPFRKGTGTFFITAGVVFGAKDLIEIDGQFDMSDPKLQTLMQYGLLDKIEVEVGDQTVCAGKDGSLAAALQVNGVRPYVGLGWGRAIPERRLGFRFEVGALMLGKSQIVSDNLVNSSNSQDMTKINEFLSDVAVLPQISFSLTYRMFKDNKKK